MSVPKRNLEVAWVTPPQLSRGLQGLSKGLAITCCLDKGVAQVSEGPSENHVTQLSLAGCTLSSL